MTSIYVKNLPPEVKEDAVRQLFEKYGKVSKVNIIMDPVTGKSKGFGFVEMLNGAEAAKAIKELDGKEIAGHQIKVSPAFPQGSNKEKKSEEKPAFPDPSGRAKQPSRDQNQNNDCLFPRHIVPYATAHTVGKGFPIEHVGLRVNTFAVWEKVNREEKFSIDDIKDRKASWPKGVSATTIASEIKRRHSPDAIVEIKASTASRLIVGIGGESVYETGLTLHHTYGIPYIPGQAVKGATRSLYLLEKHHGDEKEALKKDARFVQLFGDQTQQGIIIFYDAFPTAPGLTLELDIMNPHYAPYYQEGKPPADYHQPNPIKFLVVPAKTEFLFLLALTGPAEQDLLTEAVTWVKKTLADHGVGAKTAVGYGYFAIPQKS